MLPLLPYFCLWAWTWQWVWPKSRACFCKKSFWVHNSCSTTLASPGCCAGLDQCCGNDPADPPSPTHPCTSWGQLLSTGRGEGKHLVSSTEQRFVITCALRGRGQRGMQWLTGNTWRMEMTLETRLSFTKPCTYRPLLSPELAMLNGGNWPKRSSLGGNVGRGRIGDTFARRKWASLFAHRFCTTLKQRVALHEHVALWELSTCRTFIKQHKYWWLSNEAFPQVPAPDGSKRKPSCVQGCCRTSCVTRMWHLPWPRGTMSCILVFFSHCSALMLSQCVNSSQEMLVRMPGECFHHKWLIRVKYCVCLYLATRGPNQRQH